jgi:asparaginyl-tRNA synthetase
MFAIFFQRSWHIGYRLWVKTRRDSRGVHFFQLSDGSNDRDPQVVVEKGIVEESLMQLVTTGAKLRVEGVLVESPAPGQPVELRAQAVTLTVYDPARTVRKLSTGKSN